MNAPDRVELRAQHVRLEFGDAVVATDVERVGGDQVRFALFASSPAQNERLLVRHLRAASSAFRRGRVLCVFLGFLLVR